MLKQVTSKRPVALLALLMLAAALLVVGANSAYATHEPDVDPPTLPFFDDFGLPQDYRGNSDDVIHWDENEDEPQDCAVKNAGGTNMALQLSNGCDAYVSFEVPYGTSLIVKYDWGYRTTGGTNDDGDLEVRVVQLDPDTLTILSTSPTHTESFLPRSNTGPIYPGEAVFDLASPTAQRTTIIQVHFKGTSEGARDWAWVDNVDITMRGVFPIGTVSHSQGHYHNVGEALTCDVLAEMSSDTLAAMSVDAITGITTILASASVGVEMASEDVNVAVLAPEDVRALCFFLVGDQGGQDDCSFLPAGKLSDENGRCRPKSNLAAQDITLRANLNLDGVYGEWGVDEGVEFRPIYLDYYLNIDPVLGDPIWGDVYPLENTFGDEALGACGTGITEGLCAAGADAELTTLGVLVQQLDDAGTTVGDMLAAADTLLLRAEDAEIAVSDSAVILSRIDVTNILSLINKSYDEGVPTGVVTAWDYDPVR